VPLDSLKHRKGAVRTVRNIVERALIILGTSKGKTALVTHAKNVINELIRENQNHMYPQNDLNTFSKMPGYIDKFLASLWNNFPVVNIENDDEDASFFRKRWAPKGTTLDSDTAVFVASKSGKLFLCLDVSPFTTPKPTTARRLMTFPQPFPSPVILRADLSVHIRSWTNCSSPRTMTISSHTSST
jgi:hypothetical protein